MLQTLLANLGDANVPHAQAQFSNTDGSAIATSARKTALEATAAFTIMGWINMSNSGLYAQRICGVHPLTSAQAQWIFSLNNPGGTVAGASAHLRLIIFTNASNYIYIDSENIFQRNKPTYFVASWNGVNSAGFDLYLNGVKEASPTRSGLGTFTTPHSDADLRFAMGRYDSAHTRGNVRNLAFVNRKISDTEALEAYQDGRRKENTSLSFYADVVADWPLMENTDCLNDSNFNMTEAAGITLTFVRKSLNVNARNISFNKATIGNTRYVAFGGLIRISSTLAYWIGRSGTSHVLNGKIVKIAIHLDTGVVDAPVDIITDGTYDLRGGTAGVIDGKIFVFSARYIGGTDTFVDLNYWESTDGLTGETYGSRTVLTTTLPRFNCYGEVTPGAAGEYWVPMNESDGTSNYKVVLFHTTDNGANFSRVEIYSGSTKLSEPSAFKSGNNFIVLCRRNDSPFGIHQILSTDGGTVWGSPVLTNLGGSTGAANCCMCANDIGEIMLLFMNRGTYESFPAGSIFASKNTRVADVVADPTQYVTGIRIASSYDADSLEILGYPNVLNLGNNQYLVTYSAEASSSVADLYVGFGEIRG